MGKELLVVVADQRLKADVKQALSTEYSFRDCLGRLPTLAQITAVSPPLLIIESNLYDLKNDEVLDVIKSGFKALVCGGNWSDSKQIRAFTEGMSGYCNEQVKPIVIQEAVKSILKGDIWIKQNLISTVINSLLIRRQEDTRKKDLEKKIFDALSDRELEVVRRVQRGESNKEIADKLHISERTVKAHLGSTFKKLKVPDRLHLVVLLQQIEM